MPHKSIAIDIYYRYVHVYVCMCIKYNFHVTAIFVHTYIRTYVANIVVVCRFGQDMVPI